MFMHRGFQPSHRSRLEAHVEVRHDSISSMHGLTKVQEGRPSTLPSFSFAIHFTTPVVPQQYLANLLNGSGLGRRKKNRNLNLFAAVHGTI
jgi:hypothetical protein